MVVNTWWKSAIVGDFAIVKRLKSRARYGNVDFTLHTATKF